MSHQKDNELLTMYAVRSKDGKWFRRKGYSGYGDSWVDDIKRARIYGKPGPARAQITFWAENYPSHGVPDLVALKVTDMEVLDEAQRLEKKHKREEKAAGVRRMKMASERLETAKKEFEEAHADLTR